VKIGTYELLKGDFSV
nr:RecName: Full=38 kDa cell wall protein [Solanum lycopersicum]